MSEDLKGYLVVKVLEAAGQNGDDVKVWDDSVKEAFAKIEIRGGSRTVKQSTVPAKVVDGIVSWDEQLVLEHLDGAAELRILLCRPKPAGERGTSIISACGIYMQDILEAVPIDKYFELFKPGEGAEGGFIRISMNYLKPDQVRNVKDLVSKKKKRAGFIPKLLLTAAIVGVGAVAVKTYKEHNKNGSEKQTNNDTATTKNKGFWGKK